MEDVAEFANAYNPGYRSVSPYPESVYYSERSVSPMPNDCVSPGPYEDVFYPQMYHPQSAQETRAEKERKRRRRKHDQIDRKYSCDYPTCSKSYGTVTHLNTHRIQKGHGARLTKADFA